MKFTATNAAAFKRACKAVALAADKGDLTPILTGVRVERVGDYLTLTATDRYRALRVTMRGGAWEHDHDGEPLAMTIKAETFSRMARAITAKRAKSTAPFTLDFDPENGALTADFGEGPVCHGDATLEGDYPRVDSIIERAHAAPRLRAGAALSPQFLIDLARMMPSKTHPVRLTFVSDGDGPSMVGTTWDDDGETSFAHVLMPVRDDALDEATRDARGELLEGGPAKEPATV